MIDAPFSDLTTSDECCFLCGANEPGITQEHVFPKWLQHRYNLWDQRIGLLNDTQIQYRNLRIPCCSRCNNEDLSRLETVIASAVAAGYESASSLDGRLWYLWAAKLFYGILRRELTLLHNRAIPDGGSIVPAATLKSFSNLHMFLQGIRGRHQFVADPPYSVLVCNLHDVGSLRNYCFRDNLAYMVVALRMGDLGVIVALEDGGLTATSYGRFVLEVAGRKLHPIQFDELCAKVSYQLSLLKGGVSYVTSKVLEGERPMQTYVQVGGYLHEWSREEFSKVLRVHVSDWLKDEGLNTQWFVPPNLVPTWMTAKSGELLLKPLPSWEAGNALDA